MRRWHIADAPTPLQIEEIAEALASGSVVLMPTDTIYGLHAAAANEDAVARIAEVKGRDDTKPRPHGGARERIDSERRAQSAEA